MTPLSVEIVDDPVRLERITPEWRALLARSDNDQPTLSPLWVLTWWNVFGDSKGRRLRVVLFRDGGRLVGLAPLLWRRAFYPPGIPVRRIELIGSGETEADETCSDYIGIIAERGAEQGVARTLARLLRANALDRWDDLILPAMSSESVMTSLLNVAMTELGGVRYQVSTGCPYIPLPQRWDEYLGQLSSSSRYKVRRSIRDFERWAGDEVRVRVAETPAQLEEGRAILHALHRERWAENGQDGVFTSMRFRAFHDAVMPGLLAQEALELLWIEARGRPVAALYNIVWNGKVHFYQSGRSTDVPGKVRPGLAAHAYAIQRAISRGRREYDFLAGTSDYKMQLATAVRPLGRLHVTHSRLVSRLRRVAEAGLDLARSLRERRADTVS
jgi:CelD/BcsL family acetyltransferase involved in cellulose biosynthesis